MTIRSGHPRKRRSARTAPIAVTVLVGAAVIVALTALGTAVVQREPARWNVLLITLDTTRADRIGCYGAARAATPTIDRISRDGVRYENCYSPAPLTQPSHASILTGLLPPRHAIHDNGPEALSPGIDTLAERLARHDYQTGAVVGAFVLDREFGFDQGFDHYDDDMSQGSPAGEFRYAERGADQVTEAALRWLKQCGDHPFFLWVHYFDPHAPYAPPGYNPKFATRSAYDAEIAYVDAELARLVDAVDDRQGRQTLIIVTSDHGEGLGQHGEPTHGLFAYDSTMRVPLIVRLPDGRDAGQVVGTPVSVVDIMPSVLSWLSLDVPTDLDGLPLPTGTEQPSAIPSGRAIYLENRFVANEYGWAPLTGIVRRREKFIHAPRPEVYDLEVDPDERKNLYRQNEPRSLRLERCHDDLLASLDQRQAYASRELTLDNSDLDKLRALGYVAAATPRSDPQPAGERRRDVKDMVNVYGRIQEAINLLERGRSEAAGRIVINIIRTDDPTNPRALRLLAMLCSDGSEPVDAVVDCLLEVATGARRDRLDAFALGRLGEALVRSQRYEPAVEVLQRLVDREPRHAAAFRYLGDAHAAVGHRQASLRAYRSALRLTSTLTEPPPWIDHVLAEMERLSR